MLCLGVPQNEWFGYFYRFALGRCASVSTDRRTRVSEKEEYARNQEKDKKKEYDQLYHSLNKDRTQEYDRQFRKENKDKMKNYYRDYYLRNKGEKPEPTHSAFYNRNSDLLKESNRLYHLRNRDKRREAFRENYVCRVELRREDYLRNHDNVENYFPRNALKSWKTPQLVRGYFESIASVLGIAYYTDWYRISRFQVRFLGGNAIYSKFGSLGRALKFAYPELDWDLDSFSHRGKKSEQRLLKTNIEKLLPGVEIFEEFQHSELLWGDSDRRIELDLWIPNCSVGIEYHGEHHYFNLEKSFGPNGACLYAERDSSKVSLCQEHGITLIVIPFWWDGELSSLASTLYRTRPDVFPPAHESPIPCEMPVEFRVVVSGRFNRKHLELE